MRITCILALCVLSAAETAAAAGTVWNELNTAKGTGTFRALAEAPDLSKLISVGTPTLKDGPYQISTDQGLTWSGADTLTIGGSATPVTSDIFDIKVSGERLIMVGSKRLLLTSDDNGATWDAPTPANINALATRFSEVAVTDTGLFVVGTSGAIIESDNNGDDWKRETAPSADYRGVAGDGSSTMVAVGLLDNSGGGIIATRAVTTSGTNDEIETGTWTKVTTLPISLQTRNLTSVAYNGTTFVSVGQGGTILTSADGTTWENHSLPSGGTQPDFTNVIVVGNAFVVCGNTNVIYTSSDEGETWTTSAAKPSGTGLKSAAMQGLGTSSKGIFCVGGTQEVWFSEGGFDFYVANAGFTGADAAVDADPDHDGITNLTEFVLGLNPAAPATEAERQPLPHALVNAGAPSVAFTLPTVIPTGITVTMETATTLNSTTSGTPPVTTSPFTTYATLNANGISWKLAKAVTPSPITVVPADGKSATTVKLSSTSPVFFRLKFTR